MCSIRLMTSSYCSKAYHAQWIAAGVRGTHHFVSVVSSSNSHRIAIADPFEKAYFRYGTLTDNSTH